MHFHCARRADFYAELAGDAFFIFKNNFACFFVNVESARRAYRHADTAVGALFFDADYIAA
jgi:hypothetical protein